MRISVRLSRSVRGPHGTAAFLQAFVRRGKRKGKDLDLGGVPVEPNRPNTLTGGAAAALEFDE